ncbi:Signal recognition particle protein [Candidatus Hepatincolaceae symbiont of Richtersius coronifer]
MFENITSRFKDVFTSLGKKPSITEKDLDEILKEVRLVLLEADVALELTKILVAKMREDLLGKEIYRSISPKAVIFKSLYDNLIDLLATTPEEAKLFNSPITYQMLVGLQGSGKTTTAAKLAYYLKNSLNKKALLVSLDLNRAAAYEQLFTLAKANNLDFFEYATKDLDLILSDVKQYAAKNYYDVVILDTAGRLSIDEELMSEMQHIYEVAKPKEVLLVMDSMVGQISFGVAKAFSNKVPLSGMIVSKADADSRGGAIISAKYVTAVPIKFIGTGEKIDKLEAFSPKKIVDRLLDQGDILSLVEKIKDIQEELDEEEQKNLEKGIFTMVDLKKQLLKMDKMGGIGGAMAMIPGMAALKDKVSNVVLKDNIIKKNVAIIDSMTKLERRKPEILNFSRKKRIAKGSGTTLQDINILLKQYENTAKMMKKFRNTGMKGLKDMLKNLGGSF